MSWTKDFNFFPAPILQEHFTLIFGTLRASDSKCFYLGQSQLVLLTHMLNLARRLQQLKEKKQLKFSEKLERKQVKELP